MILSIADIFIRRPVLTTVFTIIIVLLGAISIPLLPVQYVPQIAPIQVQVAASYAGADPQTIETTVTTPIERLLNSTRGMQYMTSASTSGSANISAFFSADSDPNTAQVNVQNNLQQAISQLPAEVQQEGINVKVASPDLLQVYGFYSPNDTYDPVFISNYVDLSINDEIARIPGVGQVTIFGQRQYAIRVWLDPTALASRGVTVEDVVNAVKAQNLVVGGGAIGGEPAPKGQRFQIPLVLNGMIQKVSDAENIVIKTASNGSLIRLSDVGRAELGAQSYSSSAKINGKPGVGFGIYQLPGYSALDVVKQIETKMQALQQSFPPGLVAVPVFETVGFIKESTKEAIITLLEAIGLVVLVIFVFLQDWRATVIPTIAIPVSLIGSMIFAKVLGFSLNTLTLFGIVLATGLVVDDAILVVEAISTKIKQGMPPRQASIEAMNELTGAVIATSLVLMAVFIPVAFFPGATGALYKQFALIIAFSIAVSTFNALTFSPSAAALLLRSPTHHRERGDREDTGEGTSNRGRGLGEPEHDGHQQDSAALPISPTLPSSSGNWFFRQFNRGFAWVLGRYIAIVKVLIRLRYFVIGLFVVGLAATVVLFRVVPTGFVPAEDQGALLGIVQGPDVVSLQYTEGVLSQVEQILKEIPEIRAMATFSGFGFNGSTPNQGLFFTTFKPWSERPHPNQNTLAILQRLNREFTAKISGARVIGFSRSPIPGFSSTGGLSMQLEDTTNGRHSFQDFQKNAQAILQQANQTGIFAVPGAFTQFSANTPQYKIDINRDQLNALNVDFSEVLSTIGAGFGSSYVTQFVLGPRYYRMYVQLDEQYRNQPQDLRQLYGRSRDGKMVSLDQLIDIKPFTGPAVISHFNEYRSILLQGNPAPGKSSGQAINAIEAAYQKAALPGIKFDWADLTREEVAAGSLGALIFLFGIVMVFLVLAAQYESYIDPLIILLTVPLALLGALSSVLLFRLVYPQLSNDVYANIALVMLIGLASKNAILIVEFANQAREQGKTIVQSALTAAEERFRPILMTAIASLVGFFPLVTATGAGANARHSIGTAVFGGLLVATFLSLLIVPVLYVAIKNLEDFFSGNKPKRDRHSPLPSSSSEPELVGNRPNESILGR